MSNRPIRSFVEMLGLLNRGRFVEKCDEHLAKAMAELEALPAEKGSATITVAITLNFESGRLDIKPAIKSKLPEEKGFNGTPFWAVDGALSVQHPSQSDMFLRDSADQRERDFG
ncbi:hypothetical protein LJR009_001628 [Bosea sp. LjRoot9]|uniref:hypothetical protein n=1 Tax=Bosea sp. LjRoot9 TaxID=3342341 RepID=UPI003ED0814F